MLESFHKCGISLQCVQIIFVHSTEKHYNLNLINYLGKVSTLIAEIALSKQESL